MVRPGMKHLLLGVAIAAVVALWTPSADAHWGYWGWGGSASYWTAGYSGCCDGWYLGVRPGPVRRLVFGPYRWYYGGWGTYYTPCCSVCWASPCCCWDTCCVSTSEFGVPAAPASQPQPQPQPTPAPKQEPSQLPPAAPKPVDPGIPGVPPPGPGPEPAGGPQSLYEPTRADSALLTVYVPYDARVFVNGLETKAVGSRRQYVSYGLAPGFRYKYEVRAEIVRDGKRVEEVQTIFLTAGAKDGLAFGFNKPAEGLAATTP